MDKYELVEDLGAGNFGAARLLRDKETREIFAVKFIERSHKIDENVAREIINHRSLKHPNVIRFKEVFLTPTHLAIVMEHAAGGALFQKIRVADRFIEYVARYYFQQLISAVHYCHNMQICHRDLKLENALLDRSPAPYLKIYDLGCSKSSLQHSKPKAKVGAKAYVAPEALSQREYDGKLADVWSCGVTLYVMLVGAYPFEDQDKPRNIQKTIQRIMAAEYIIPDYVHVSQDCKHLLSRIFVANPSLRISVEEIKSHPWFLKDLPRKLMESAQTIYYQRDCPSYSVQSEEEIMKIVGEARQPSPSSKAVKGFGWGAGKAEDEEDIEAEVEKEDEEDEYEKMVREADASEEYPVSLKKMIKYKFVKDLGAGSFAAARLFRIQETEQLVAMKYIERGHKINKSVAREIINHRSLRHPNVIQFREVVLTPTHLAIVMEYAAGGELFERICNDGRFSEDEARYFFQQLISGVHYCHYMQISHRDLKLANILLLDGSPAPRLKICDFGSSKSSSLHSKPKSTVGTHAYIAPEVLSRREYDGKLADVWSCGVVLYVMLVGAYPFEDKDEPGNFRKTIQRINAVKYKIPDDVHVSQDCRDLLCSIFVANPSMRISIKEIRSHPWFLKDLPRELTEAAQAIYYQRDNSSFSAQSEEEIMKIVDEATQPAPSFGPVKGFGWNEEEEEGEEDEEEEDEEAEVEEDGEDEEDGHGV